MPWKVAIGWTDDLSTIDILEFTYMWNIKHWRENIFGWYLAKVENSKQIMESEKPRVLFAAKKFATSFY